MAHHRRHIWRSKFVASSHNDCLIDRSILSPLSYPAKIT
jgi:hypothetical protein